MESTKHIIIIGGGASGFFSAINSAIHFPKANIRILEKSGKMLSKVKISGGGRCNVTHACFENQELIKNYPRGQKELQQVFSQFSTNDTVQWFNKRGVKLKVESDGRMFPESNTSESVIHCFLDEVKKYNINIDLNTEVLDLIPTGNKISVITVKKKYIVDAVICCIGGSNQEKNYLFLKKIGHTIDALIPSLFTINLPSSKIKELMGLSVKNGTVKVIGTKHQYTGPILITHWGLSGPAVLKLSSFAAVDFFKLNYQTSISVNWTGYLKEEEIKNLLLKNISFKTLILNSAMLDIPKRLWEYLLLKSDISLSKPWNELSKKQIHKLAQTLSNDVYEMEGKTTFKEEFVTAGGVHLKEINFKTMESKLLPNLFICGEVLNIDGITGGFNFQNAWSTAWIAAKHVLKH